MEESDEKVPKKESRDKITTISDYVDPMTKEVKTLTRNATERVEEEEENLNRVHMDKTVKSEWEVAEREARAGFTEEAMKKMDEVYQALEKRNSEQRKYLGVCNYCSRGHYHHEC